MQSNLCDLLVNFGLLVPLQHAWANAVIICSGRGKRLLICWRGAKTYWLGVGKFPWEKTKDSFLVLAWMLFSVISRSAGCGFFFFFTAAWSFIGSQWIMEAQTPEALTPWPSWLSFHPALLREAALLSWSCLGPRGHGSSTPSSGCPTFSLQHSPPAFYS